MFKSRSIALLGIATFVGCGQSGAPGAPLDDAPDASLPFGTDDAASFVNGDTRTTEAATDSGFCNGAGPIVIVGDADAGASTKKCTGQIAEATFKSALCTCHDVNLQGYLRTRGFDSTQGPYIPGTNTGGAPVGIDHDYVIPALGANAGFTDIGGSFSVAGHDSVAFAGALSIDGDFRAAGTLDLKGYTHVARNAWIGADVTNAGYGTIAGDLHITGNDVLPFVASGTRTKELVSVAPPCDCDALLDVASLVDQARVNNDDAVIGLTSNAFKDVIGLVDRTLPCGKYYVDEVSGIGDVVLRIGGRVALFVEGSVSAIGNVEVDLAPNAEIDIFVKGTLSLTGHGAFGSTASPAATRIYVGGTEDITLVGASGFVGNLYAPKARVNATGYTSIWGSVFARDFVSPGFADIVYDRAIATAANNCDAPQPTSCTRCGTCTGGSACVHGSCGACSVDDDCCGQDVCTGGRCGALIK